MAYSKSNSNAGPVCPNVPLPGYARHLFPKRQGGWCNKPPHPGVNGTGIGMGMGAWPLWSPLEAKRHIMASIDGRSMDRSTIHQIRTHGPFQIVPLMILQVPAEQYCQYCGSHVTVSSLSSLIIGIC